MESSKTQSQAQRLQEEQLKPYPKANDVDKPVPQVEDKPVKPVPKKMITVDASSILQKVSSVGIIESEQDVDDYLNALKSELVSLIKSNNKIRIR